MSDKIKKSKKSESTPNLDEKTPVILNEMASTLISPSKHPSKYGKCKKCGKEYNCKCCEDCFHETPFNTQSNSSQMDYITFSTVTNATGLPEVVVEPRGRTRSSLPSTRPRTLLEKMDYHTNTENNLVNQNISNPSNNISSIRSQEESFSGLTNETIENDNNRQNQQIISDHNNTDTNSVVNASNNEVSNIIPVNQPLNNLPNNNRNRFQIVEVISSPPVTINNYRNYFTCRRVCICSNCGYVNNIPVFQNAPFQNSLIRNFPQLERENFVTNLVTDIRNDNVLHNLQEWAFPIFRYAYSYPERVLSRIAFRIFDNCSLFSDFQINRKKFFNFFCALESGYWSIPYHNRIHAADVLHACYYLTIHPIEPFNIVNGVDNLGNSNHIESLSLHTKKSPLFSSMNSIEIMAFYAAAAMHDYDHPGRTNAFMVATNHEMATFYNDRSVLENHHAAMSWRLLCKSENFFLENMNDTEFKKFRFLVMEYILATDLRHHFEHINNFTKYQIIELDVEACRHDTLKLLMKCADICSPLKPNLLHREWTRRIVEEFYSQGDEEKRLGKQVSPFMDRLSPNIEALQHNFIRQMVTPLANALNKQNIFPCLPGLDQPELMINLRYNEKYWYNLIRLNGRHVEETNDNGQQNRQENEEAINENN
ncbi:3'5'-cyclic nucleotide phosphodiesterase,catalytic domain and HD/PDEase domain and 3'5'-cyclic nucleotide phosphodiesterase family-containing protein [Strongyloides ratti]|uniref:Phosphodiesterase n=1 Tax=Strongyloides ratti TaxID=34506 RepID=A0A090KWL9_STRRB|nr:3'5'-cyclic nucleotide phosphodiesterase,catalytic domain and HD/PDEase domain and 3'5'-cyclic nucleotide phosphodiesterase family-containing protein [Strongyloides ratti]CEF59642.1 3'5'-cyclic nucleotide phosphodiesterase,catalytic domain and HD/PDEase domain and 3'5'-cyclic nucleotide phosphodiesterase family-containing protein [Strongyloides ratti]